MPERVRRHGADEAEGAEGAEAGAEGAGKEHDGDEIAREENEIAREETADEAMTAPRPTVAVGAFVFDRERRLLVVQRGQPPGEGMWSVPGGKQEPGETLAQAVAREVREEAGLEVGHPEYIASQPWPFPTSLMLGFIAPWRSGEPRRIDDELEDVRWFERAEVEAAVEERNGALGVPPRLAIARRLMEHWVQR